MSSDIADVAIIGAGVAGAIASYRLAKEHKNLKVILFDIGRPPAKRKRQIDGFLGCLPNSDGKLYMTDVEKVSNIIGNRKVKAALKGVTNLIENITPFKITKDKSPSITVDKKLTKLGYNVQLNDYFQIFPKEIHLLSKHLAKTMEANKNFKYSFDNEIVSVAKQKGHFVITGEHEEFKAKKVIISVGRSGWRWAHNLYSNFGIIENNEMAKYGIRIEMPAHCLHDFNKSNCVISKPGELEIGPLSWFGTIIPEDHLDMAISAFRSNEDRWKSDKVSFSLIGDIPTNNEGVQQTDRMGKLTYIISNDRVLKEKVSLFLSGKSKISIMKEYNFLIDKIKELSLIMPDIITKGYFHVPTLTAMAPKINLGDNLESEVPGMYVAGESAGVSGILAAMLMGWSLGGDIVK
jgi:thioredoxin reductase